MADTKEILCFLEQERGNYNNNFVVNNWSTFEDAGGLCRMRSYLECMLSPSSSHSSSVSSASGTEGRISILPKELRLTLGPGNWQAKSYFSDKGLREFIFCCEFLP